jgi:flagellin-specific chaperone FliS
LYDTLAGNLQRAAQAQRNHDIEGRCNEIHHALLVIGFLEDWLSRGPGGPLASALKDFYASMRQALIEAGARQSADLLEKQTQRVLDLRQQWQSLDFRLEAPRPEILQPEYQGQSPYFASSMERSHGSWSA